MRNKKTLQRLAIFALGFGLCIFSGLKTQAATKTVYVTKGETAKITVKGATKKTKWKVTKSAVTKATSGKGFVTVKGKATGTATVKARIAKKNYSFKVTVETPKISKSSLKIAIGGSGSVKITGTKRAVKWISDDPYIASVDEKNGTITGNHEGDAKVYAKIGQKKYSCRVSVVDDTTVDDSEISVKELYIPKGDQKIYGKIYRPLTDGKHPAIIMSHGYNGIGDDFITECRYFAKNGYIAYAFDFCGGSGRSKSSGSSTDMTIFTEKEDVLAVFDYIYGMEEVDQNRVFLFGGSQGGLVTALATEERADKVKGMALYFPAFGIPDNWRQNYPDVTKVPETFEFWGLKLGREFVVSMHDFNTFDVIGKYDKNVLIIQGDKDNIAPISYAQRAVNLYPHAELSVMPGEGHGFTPSAGKKAMQQVLTFMENNR